MSTEPIQLVTTQPEVEVAADLKRRVGEAFAPVLKVCDEAAAAGLRIQWDNVLVNGHTLRYELIGLRVVKFY